jgi:hypothetical protein
VFGFFSALNIMTNQSSDAWEPYFDDEEAESIIGKSGRSGNSFIVARRQVAILLRSCDNLKPLPN